VQGLDFMAHPYTYIHTNFFKLIIWIGISTDYGWTAGLFPEEVRQFSLLFSVQACSGAHTDTNPLGTGGSFPGIKAAGA
jgi:hypothetical protein